jgi:hypothetical protein
MADDDQTNDSAPDPWADILGDGPAEPAADLDFSFAEPSEPSPVAEDVFSPPEAAALEPTAEADAPDDAAAAGQLEDELADAWLAEADVPGDVASAAEAPLDADGSEAGAGGREDVVAADAIDDWGVIAADQEEPSSAADTVVLDATAGAAAATVVAAAPRPAAKAKAKKGGLGQTLGVALGGMLAIPLTIGILIWGFQKDVFGVTKHVPKSVAFLLPRKFQRPAGHATATPPPQRPATEDREPVDSPAASDVPGEETVATAGEPAAISAPDPATDAAEPVPPPATETSPADESVGDDVAVDTSAVADATTDPFASTPDPSAAVPDPVATIADPMPVMPEPPVAVPQPPAAIDAAAVAAAAAAVVDPQQVDAAVEEALAAVAALEQGGAGEDSRKALLVDCYKRLAKVGEELVVFEQESADAGRPIAAPPRSVVDLHGRLGRHRDDLVRLGRNWLDYSKRPMPGVVLPVTFQASRKVGPYWSSKVTLEMPRGASRDLSVISRSEPAAVQGDAVLLMGVVFDGDVIWAADVRPPAEPGSLDGNF